MVTASKLDLFFNFIHTRLNMGEQVYIVVPAIKESEKMDLANLEKVCKRFIGLFPQRKICSLHGQ